MKWPADRAKTPSTASTSAAVSRALCSASSHTLKVRCTRSITMRLNWSWLRLDRRSITCPEASWQMFWQWMSAVPF